MEARRGFIHRPRWRRAWRTAWSEGGEPLRVLAQKARKRVEGGLALAAREAAQAVPGDPLAVEGLAQHCLRIDLKSVLHRIE